MQLVASYLLTIYSQKPQCTDSLWNEFIHRLLRLWNAQLLILINPASSQQNYRIVVNSSFESLILFQAASQSYFHLLNLEFICNYWCITVKVAHLLICNFLPWHFSPLEYLSNNMGKFTVWADRLHWQLQWRLRSIGVPLMWTLWGKHTQELIELIWI